jgi:hypothetical protein
VVNRKMKKIILLEFKRTSDDTEATSRTCGRWRRSMVGIPQDLWDWEGGTG